MQYERFREIAAPFSAVSHETFMRLKAYADLLRLWQPKINLVSQKTLDDLWERHFLDSLQLIKYLSAGDRIMDLGSGGGFPGAVLAITTGLPFSLVESDQRKSAFLLEVSRVTQTPFIVLTKRVESLDSDLDISTITARAFAPLSKILPLVQPWLGRSATGIFLKGKDAELEIEETNSAWEFDCQTHPSISDPAASILVVSNLKPR